MSSSGSDFDDDDDELLQDLIRGNIDVNKFSTQVAAGDPTSTPLSIADHRRVPTVLAAPVIPKTSGNDLQAQVYRADGEIAILRAQVSQLQQQKQDEINRMKDAYELNKKANDDQLSTLNHAVQKLEDEKKFLNNELKTASYSKRRRVGSQSSKDHSHLDNRVNVNVETNSSQFPASSPTDSTQISLNQTHTRVIKRQNDSSLLIDQLWTYCINGSSRTSLNYLSKICIDFDIDVKDLNIAQRTPIASSIIEYLMIKKNLRLDELIETFCMCLIEVIDILLARKRVLPVPFLLSLIYCSVSYRPMATSKSLILLALNRLNIITTLLSFLVDSNLNEEDFINYHDVPNQVMIIEKFVFVCCVDLIEKLVTFSSMYDEQFIKEVWSNLSVDLFIKCLPENTERFKNSTQINLVTNFVEMLVSSITSNNFAFNRSDDSTIFNSLLKVFLIDISIKEDFMFFGLNRIIGNNIDFKKIDSIIPLVKDLLDNSLIIVPEPIPFNLLNQDDQKFEMQSLHEFHLLNLRLKVGHLLESYIITKQSVDNLKLKEYFKSIIRIIGFEQIFIMRSPKSKYIHLRVQIVSTLVKVLNYLTQDIKQLNNLIYPETMYELFVVLLRIAFGSDSLSIDAYKLLLEFRNLGRNEPLFNEGCEARARELNHFNFESNESANGKIFADIESDFANGFEFPYEIDTVELAREILNIFVNHEEADNLYFNMNPNEVTNFDEMDLIE